MLEQRGNADGQPPKLATTGRTPVLPYSTAAMDVYEVRPRQVHRDIDLAVMRCRSFYRWRRRPMRCIKGRV